MHTDREVAQPPGGLGTWIHSRLLQQAAAVLLLVQLQEEHSYSLQNQPVYVLIGVEMSKSKGGVTQVYIIRGCNYARNVVRTRSEDRTPK